MNGVCAVSYPESSSSRSGLPIRSTTPSPPPQLMQQHCTEMAKIVRAEKTRKKEVEASVAGERFRVLDRAKLRLGFEQTSDDSGFLQRGEIVEALEGKLNANGAIRIRTSRGWVNTQAADGTILLSSSAADLDPQHVPDVAVSEHGLGGVTALAADFARETGAVGERLFDVTQSFVKKAPKECQLKVSQMSVQLFTGDRVHASWMYTTLSNWEYSKSKKTIAFTSKKGSTASGVADTVSLGVASDEIGLAVLDLMVHTPDAPP